MFTLTTPHVLAASASAATVVKATAALDSVVSGADGFDGAPPVALGTGATSVLAPAAGTQILVKSLHFFNTDTAARTLKVYYPVNTNQVYQAIIPASGSAVWTPDSGWKVYDSTGLEQKLNLKTDSFATTTSPGPYPLSFTPDGRLQVPTLGGVVVPLANISVGAGGITFSGDAATALAAGSFASGTFSYSY